MATPRQLMGMAASQMITAMGFDFLAFLPPVFLHIALVAWTAAFIGLVLDVLRRVRAGRSIRGFVPAAVEAYVTAAGLYR